MGDAYNCLAGACIPVGRFNGAEKCNCQTCGNRQANCGNGQMGWPGAEINGAALKIRTTSLQAVQLVAKYTHTFKALNWTVHGSALQCQ
jgi:hypothetical protein